MKKIKKVLSYIFIDGLSGMALGLFSTLIIGTILDQITSFMTGTDGIAGKIGLYIHLIALIAKALTGAGIGAGMAFKYNTSPLVGVSAAVAGMVGAFASKALAGSVATEAGMLFSGPGDPLGAFIAAFVAIQIGKLISGKTPLDIILTPAVSILTGGVAGLLIGPPCSIVTTKIGELVDWGTNQHPFVMGIVVSVIMGICLTLPISSAAIGVILGLKGIAAGAAVVGCCCQMVGFAVISYRENKFGGLIAQGVGTSMIQMPNIIKHPQIWIPSIIASAILGPISTVLLQMECNASGSGMGTSGLVGQFMTYATMTEAGVAPVTVIIEILAMHVILPAILCLIIAEFMRKKNFIHTGDMSLDIK